jgi:LytS/YehU family sensor histidine kinase
MKYVRVTAGPKEGTEVIEAGKTESMVFALKENEADDTTGIKNVKERLDNAYPGKYSLNIFDERSLVKVEIKVPRNE